MIFILSDNLYILQIGSECYLNDLVITKKGFVYEIGMLFKKKKEWQRCTFPASFAMQMNAGVRKESTVRILIKSKLHPTFSSSLTRSENGGLDLPGYNRQLVMACAACRIGLGPQSVIMPGSIYKAVACLWYDEWLRFCLSNILLFLFHP